MVNELYEKFTGKDLQEFDYERRAQIQEDEFVKQYGGYNFFDGGDAEAQYVFRRLLADRWIEL